MKLTVEDPIKFAAEVVGKDPFATLLGIVVEEVKDSYARVSLKIKEEYCNAAVRAHGGAVFSVADQAFAIACNSRGYSAFAAEMKINYFQGVSPGKTLVAVATPLDIRKRISLWNIDVTDSDGEKIALAHGLAYHFVK